MLASFIISYHSKRSDNLFQVLRFLNKWHPIIKDCQIVTLCQDKCQNYTFHESIFELCKLFKCHEHIDLNLNCMHFPKVTNIGVDKATSDKLIVLESDRILPKDYFAKTLEQLEPGIQITCQPMRKIIKETQDDDIETGLFESTCDNRNINNEIGVKNMWSGNTAICKSDYLKSGGMDEKYVGYGWADSDMTHATEKAGVRSVFRQETELHLWHPGITYGQGDQKEMFIQNGIYFCKKWRQPYNQWFANELHKGKRLML